MFQSVGMRPLERGLEKLDDVKKKKLSDMIAAAGGDATNGTNSGLLVILRYNACNCKNLEYQEIQILLDSPCLCYAVLYL